MTKSIEVEFTNAQTMWDPWQGLSFEMLALVLPMLSPSQRRMLENGMAKAMLFPDIEYAMSNAEAVDREMAYRFVIEEVQKFRAGSGKLDTHVLAGQLKTAEPANKPSLF